MCVASARGGLRLRGGEGGAEDISGGDGGVMKELLVEGVGEEFPRANDDVSVHYVGTLQADGTEFDSSRARNAPFTFKLGQVWKKILPRAILFGFCFVSAGMLRCKMLGGLSKMFWNHSEEL